MDDDQQFCLRWNNHQSTLVSVFDTLLENEKLVDCTLAAEGKSLKAHKVVLSACSPYFESLLAQQYDKHPIFILKDVKFQELKAMMDYMYRGEVNISQDQLAALLKAAESLQIKGLSDGRNKQQQQPADETAAASNSSSSTSSSSSRKAIKEAPALAAAAASAVATTKSTASLPKVQGLTIEQRKIARLSEHIEGVRSREGSASPVPRKRKKPRRRTSTDDSLALTAAELVGSNNSHDAAAMIAAVGSVQEVLLGAATANIPASLGAAAPSTSKTPAAAAATDDVPDNDDHDMALDAEPPVKTEGVSTRQKAVSLPPAAATSDAAAAVELLHQVVPTVKDQQLDTEVMLEPKAEYIDDDVNDSVEDLTLDEDDLSNMDELDQSRAGPSHGDASAQGFGGWQLSGDRTQDEVFMAAQEAVGAQRDSQGRQRLHHHLQQRLAHRNRRLLDSKGAVNGGGGSGAYPCSRCGRHYKHLGNLRRHQKYECGHSKQFQCLTCARRFHQSSNLKRHIYNRHTRLNRYLQVLENI